MPSRKIAFVGANGAELAARLDLPPGEDGAQHARDRNDHSGSGRAAALACGSGADDRDRDRGCGQGRRSRARHAQGGRLSQVTAGGVPFDFA